MRNLLFVCSRNQWRSPTAEYLYSSNPAYPNLNTRSRGTVQSARQVIKADDVRWADTIFVMENKHKRFIYEQFRPLMDDKTLIVLDIPDDYQYRDPELVDGLIDVVNAYLAS